VEDVPGGERGRIAGLIDWPARPLWQKAQAVALTWRPLLGHQPVMPAKEARSATLLGELRRLEWRRLMLAFALLALWARLISPLPVQAAATSGDSWSVDAICRLVGDASARGGAPAPPGHDDRLCPLCRLAETESGLPPCPAVGAIGVCAAILGMAELPAASPVQAFAALPPPRGPPGIVATF
jgi:hypothetical protein